MRQPSTSFGRGGEARLQACDHLVDGGDVHLAGFGLLRRAAAHGGHLRHGERRVRGSVGAGGGADDAVDDGGADGERDGDGDEGGAVGEGHVGLFQGGGGARCGDEAALHFGAGHAGIVGGDEAGGFFALKLGELGAVDVGAGAIGEAGAAEEGPADEGVAAAMVRVMRSQSIRPCLHL